MESRARVVFPAFKGPAGCLSLGFRARAGSVQIDGVELTARPEVGEPMVIDLSRPIAAHFEVWPQGRRRGLLAVTIAQGGRRAAFQAPVGWSAVPREAALKASSAPWVSTRALLALWGRVREIQAAVGPPLAEIREGLHPPIPRVVPSTPEAPRPPEVPKPRRARLRDMPWFGTRDAIFTFGVNTRGFIVFGINVRGVVVFGVNAIGVVVVGCNAVAGLGVLGFNAVAPLAVTGFNIFAILVLTAAFNDPMTPLADAAPWVLLPVALVQSAIHVAVARGFLKRARDFEEAARRNDPLAEAVINRWTGWGFALGALLAPALAVLLILMPRTVIQAFFLALLKIAGGHLGF